MLKLAAAPVESAWLDLIPGVRVRVRPASVASVVVGQTEAGRVFRAEGAIADPNTGANATIAMVGSMARFAIAEWEGVGDDAGEPAPVTLENIDALMRVWPAYDAFDRLYVTPALNVSTEKNG